MSNEILKFTNDQASAFVKNAADALIRLLPRLDGDDRASTEMCAQTLLRTALHLNPQAYGIEASISDAASESVALNAIEDKAAELLASVNSGDTPEGRRFDEAPLLAYLRAHPLGGEQLCIKHSRVLAGGRSKQTILLELEGSKSMPRDCVVRRDWASSVTGTSVTSEFELLKRVFEQGLKVPEPVLLEGSGEALGNPFVIMKRVEGTALGDPFTPPETAGPILDLAEQLGKLHRLDVELFRNLPEMKQENSSTAQLEEKLKTYRGIISQFGTPCLAVERALLWLEEHVSEVEGHTALVHADLGFHNLLCHNDKVSAILDWELAHIGNPALDLGYLRSVVSQRVAWSAFLEAYQGAGGPVIAPRTIDFFTLFASVWLYQLLLQARFAIAGGHVTDLEIAHVCSHFLPALLARISREVELVCENNE